jgi:hypothetical protein
MAAGTVDPDKWNQWSPRGRTLRKGLGAHAGDIETFIEVEFDLDGKKVIPDGLIRVSRGSRVWAALVEVKTGRNELQSEQLENYLEVARRNGLQALLTISNQTPVAAGVHPPRSTSASSSTSPYISPGVRFCP